VGVAVPDFIKIGRTITEIWRFNGYENGGTLPPRIFEIQTNKFCITVPNFVKISQTVAEISRFL